MKRLFIESDVLDESELRYSQHLVSYILEELKIPFTEEVFDETIDFAWHEPTKAWEAVKRSDEIYAYSGLVPLLGYGSYTGAPVVMDVMMAKAIEENIINKSVYFLRQYNKIDWGGINEKLLPKAFLNNKLFTLDDDSNYFKQVDIKKLVKSLR